MVNTHTSPEHAQGYELYPERRKQSQSSLKKVLAIFESNPVIEHLKCERNVRKCLKDSLLVKTMLFALRNSGCDVDFQRHISCEPCHPSVTGGFDAEMNQVVICQNGNLSQGSIQANLAHELLHMFDFCRAKLDFKNPEHVACTEIRAASILHCSFMTAWLQGESSPFNFYATHKNCVKNKAVNSVMAASGISRNQAEAAVDKVFPVCYNDLEPLGRRLRRKSDDIEHSYRDRFSYGSL